MSYNKTLSLTNRLLGDIEEALNNDSYEAEWYLDIEEEKIIFMSEYGGFVEEQEEMREMIENDDEGRFIAIPRTTSREGWEQLKRFILSLDDQDEKTQNLLLNTIQGSGAFRRFKDAVYDIGLQDRWYDFKNREDRKEALDWLRAQNLITDEQVEEGMQLYEELLQKRKSREMEIANMTKGRRVRCTDTIGHENKLTVGKVYDILDEQKQHLNIRINDDRGKKCWLPKSHFELVTEE
jgi:hypothetical protein